MQKHVVKSLKKPDGQGLRKLLIWHIKAVALPKNNLWARRKENLIKQNDGRENEVLDTDFVEKILSCRLQNSDGCDAGHTLGCLLPRPSPLPSYWYLLEACPTAVSIFLHNLKQLGRINTLDRNLFSVNDLKPQKFVQC